MSKQHAVRGGRACALLSMTMFGAAPSALFAWDITDTGQPYTDAKFSVTEGTWMNVDVSPDGRTLVFDLLGDIYSLPVTGGEARLLHGGPAMEYDPRFSPDGSKILYVSDRAGSTNLWSSGVDGSGARQVTSETINPLATPAWSPDGRFAAAARYSVEQEKLTGGELWLYHMDGGKGRLLVEGPKNGKAVQEPLFSRDGRYLYYSENISSTPGMFVNANQPIYAIKRRALADGKVEEVVSGFGGATTPQVSPDDRRIAFVRRVKARTVLFVYDVNTGQQRPVYDGLDRDLRTNWNPRNGSSYPHFAWLPDNKHIVIWSGGKLNRIDVDSQGREDIPFRASVEQRITAAPRFENALTPDRFTVRAIHQIALSPDGKSVVFNALGRLWQKSLPGGQPQRLTKSAAFEFEPTFSKDGSVAYVSWSDEQGGTLEVLAPKGRAKTLLKGFGLIRQPAFSPDGKQLVYWVDEGNRKIGGFRGKAGLYTIAAAGGTPVYLGPVGKNPQFAPDGKRIYYIGKDTGAFGIVNAMVLESVDINGLDRRQHVLTEDMDEMRISPDLSWLAYRKDLQYFVMPYRDTGTLFKLTKKGEEMPSTALTELGGFEMTWSADSRRLAWVLGPTLYTTSLDGRASASTKPAVVETPFGLDAATDKPQGKLAFTHARIITLEGEKVIESGTVVVDGNRIVAVGADGEVQVPADAKTIDASGKTIMPGLVDMHGHLDSPDDDFLMPQRHAYHYAALAFGVTTDFDPSGKTTSFVTAETNRAGVTVGPRLINSGKVIYGLDAVGMFHPINTPQDADKIIAHKKALGAIMVKSYMQPTRAQREELIKAARAANVMVTPEGEGNLYNNLTMVLDGHTSIEHNIPIANYYEDLVQLIARSSTSLTPTIIVTNGETFAENYFYETTRSWDDPKVRTFLQMTRSSYSPLGGSPDAPPYVRGMVTIHQADELWDVGFRAVARAMKKVDDAGGVVNAGGHGQIHGLAMHWEMWALAEGGMSPLHVLRAASLNGARTMGLDKQIGTITTGKLADLLVLDANPLDNIRNTNTVRYTMINGRLYDSLTMNEIGNHPHPRGKFYWELEDHKGIDWNESWANPGLHRTH